MTTTAINFNKAFPNLGSASYTTAAANQVLCAFTGGYATASTSAARLGMPIPDGLREDLDLIEKVRAQTVVALSPRSTRTPAAVIVGAVGTGDDLDSVDVLLELHESVMRAEGAYQPVSSQVNAILNLQKADALVRHTDDIMDVMRAIAAPMFKQVRYYIDLGTNVRLDSTEGFKSLPADAVNAWAQARDADASLALMGQVIAALGHLATPEISAGGLLLFAELSDDQVVEISRKYQVPVVDLRAPWMAVEAAGGGDLASPSQWVEREQDRGEQAADAMARAAKAQQDAWKGLTAPVRVSR